MNETYLRVLCPTDCESVRNMKEEGIDTSDIPG